MNFDSRQAHTSEVFRSLWGEDSVYSFKENAIDLRRLDSFSDGKLYGWLSEIFLRKQTTILDAGCGLGFGFVNIIDTLLSENGLKTESIIYHGIDLIPLDKTSRFLDEWKSNFKNRPTLNVPSIDISLTQISMLTPPESLVGNCDFVMALGTLHHTPSVEQSLESTLTCLNSGGYYLGWIINEQKPFRRITDEFFRGYFSEFDNIAACESELSTLAEIFTAMGRSMGDSEIEINADVEFLGLEKGKYRLQTLLYDHFIKCYSVEGESRRRQIQQLFDWFSPHYYHQTNRAELESMLTRCEGVNVQDIVTKTNGHFFFLRKD